METKTKRIIASALGLLLGLAGVFILTQFVQNSAQQATAGQQLTQVFVASQNIPVNTPADQLEGLVAQREIPVSALVPNAVTSIENLGDLVSQERILTGEQLVIDRFGETEARVIADSPGIQVPDGLFEVTFSIPAERAVGGQISPLETIAIAATTAGEGGASTFTRFVLRDVLIVNIQGTLPTIANPIEGEEQQLRTRDLPTGELFITVALTPEDAQRLIFANEQTSLWIVREPEVPPENPDDPISFTNLFGEGVIDSEVADQLAAVDQADDDIADTTPAITDGPVGGGVPAGIDGDGGVIASP